MFKKKIFEKEAPVAVFLLKKKNVLYENNINPILQLTKLSSGRYIIQQPLLDSTLSEILKKKKEKIVQQDILKNAILDTLKALLWLYSQHILHNDIHFANILYDTKKKRFFLIDWSESSFVKNKKDRLLLFWREDIFSLLWFSFFQTTEMKSDFKKVLLQLENVQLKKNVKKLVLPLLPDSSYSKLHMFNSYMKTIKNLKNKKLTLDKYQSIEIKLFLNRLYLCLYLYITNSKFDKEIYNIVVLNGYNTKQYKN